MEQFQRIRAEIDLDALAFNFDTMYRKLSPGAKLAAVIKADGYGHGALEIARLLEDRPYLWGFAVAAAEEALELRRGGIKKPIMLLSYAFCESWKDMIEQDIRFTVFDLDTAAGISDLAVKLGKEAYIHIALDTGMSRIGFADNTRSIQEIKTISVLPSIVIEGLFTHFAQADEPSIAPAQSQLERYLDFSDKLKKDGVRIPIRHTSNSAGIFRLKEAHLDMARAGITLYGLLPSDEIAEEVKGILPVMRLVSHISFVKDLSPGSKVSYGGTFTADKEMRVATIPVGYADGYPRLLSGKGHVLIRGKRAGILGRVCMDQFMVDVTEIEGAARGDEVVLLGSQGEEFISAEQLGALSGRFNYELVCDIGKRVPRCFMAGGKCIGVRKTV
ncbi:MAG: alanine racemase [Lachnospiraceae bacterium]|nr:alanine racemase [Lachnospiraceae bacterium]